MFKNKKIVLCKNCQTPIPKGAKKCPNCGTKYKKPLYQRWWIILLALIIGLNTVNKIQKVFKERIDWNELILVEQLPKQSFKKGVVYSDSPDHLYVNVKNVSSKDYLRYVEACKDMGYLTEAKEDGFHYQAFGSNEYKLALSFYDKEMTIELEAPMNLASFSWPSSELAQMIPPLSQPLGKIDHDSSERLKLYVGNMPLDAFNQYIEACIANGFNTNYQRNETRYEAQDVNGNRLCVEYRGNKVMAIELTLTKEENKPQKEQETNKPEETTKQDETIRANFKQAMDSYESFIQEYVTFMKKYQDSSDASLSMLADYADYMAKYASFVKDFDAWESEDLNDAELAYYLEVQARVTKLLLEVE